MLFYSQASSSTTTTKPIAEATTTATTTSRSSTPAASVTSSSSSSSGEYSAEYCLRLKALNEQVAKWISEHVAKDPVVLLTPIFKGENSEKEVYKNKVVLTSFLSDQV